MAESKSVEDWTKELRRRIDQYEQGKSSTKSWEEVKKNAQALLHK